MLAEATRDRILARARVVLAMGGRPTVADFASAAGVSRASFYRAFKSRDELIEALDRTPEPAARERILDAALEMVGARGLAAVSMDDLADKAQVSRATLYRLFPGKSALFSALITAFSPMEPVSTVLNTMAEEPPSKVMPAIARAVYHTLFVGGENRTGLLRALFFEITSLAPDTEEATRETVARLVGAMVMYVQRQMSEDRLRSMHPLLALQAFIGPIFFHLMTRNAVERVLGMEIDGEQVVTDFADAWLRAMSPEGDKQ